MNFQQKLEKAVKKNNSLLCVGLDSDVEKMSSGTIRHPTQFSFNKAIIEATSDLVCSYKLNTAFYESIGHLGIKALKDTCDYLMTNYPEIPIIIDAKRGDIGNTNKGYVQFVFTYLGGDAVTMHPYLGEEAIRPFLDEKDKGIFVLCRTSNSGAGEFQDIEFKIKNSKLRINRKLRLYEYVAYQASHSWNMDRNVGLVVGATYPEELKNVREIAGEQMWFLVPGIGAQGGDTATTMKAGLNKKGTGLIINSSRGIIFSKDPRVEAAKLRDKINQFR